MKAKSKRTSHGIIKLVKRLTTAQSKKRINKINKKRIESTKQDEN